MNLYKEEMNRREKEYKFQLRYHEISKYTQKICQKLYKKKNTKSLWMIKLSSKQGLLIISKVYNKSQCQNAGECGASWEKMITTKLFWYSLCHDYKLVKIEIYPHTNETFDYHVKYTKKMEKMFKERGITTIK